MSVLYHLRNTSNIGELLEGYASRQLADKDVQRLSFLVNRPYDSVASTEVDDPGGVAGTPEPMPYFTVASFGRSYGSESMGLGELSMFCLWWNLSRVEPGSIVLIDEPEAFTSPHSQYALVDELIRFSVEKELTLVLATQSQPIIDSLEDEAIRMLLPGDSGVTVEVSPPKALLLSTLGIVVPKQGVILVEDRVARFVATTAIGIVAPDLLQVADLVESDGAGPLDQALRLPSVDEGWFHLLGVFDGDQRASDRTGLRWPFTFLPGTRSPESELRLSLETDEAAAAAALGRSSANVAMARAAAAGLEGHDWLERIARQLGIGLEPLVAALTRLWIDRERVAFDAFVAEIRTRLGA